eukprot:ctg_628.g156
MRLRLGVLDVRVHAAGTSYATCPQDRLRHQGGECAAHAAGRRHDQSGRHGADTAGRAEHHRRVAGQGVESGCGRAGAVLCRRHRAGGRRQPGVRASAGHFRGASQQQLADEPLCGAVHLVVAAVAVSLVPNRLFEKVKGSPAWQSGASGSDPGYLAAWRPSPGTRQEEEDGQAANTVTRPEERVPQEGVEEMGSSRSRHDVVVSELVTLSSHRHVVPLLVVCSASGWRAAVCQGRAPQRHEGAQANVTLDTQSHRNGQRCLGRFGGGCKGPL